MKDNRNIQPPKLADRFFKWYCCSELSETILGDLHEDYLFEFDRKGPLRSKVDYWINIFRFINRHTLKRKRQQSQLNSNSSAMLRNYLLITVRSLWKNKGYTAINVFGLALGLASGLIIFFYVQQELSVDQFHTKHQNIYRVTNSFERTSGSIYWASTPPALAPGIRNNISGIESVTRLRYADDHTYTVGDRSFSQGNAFFADSLFLRMFDFKLLTGDRNTALSSPNTIVITEEMATKYFGKDDPMGQIITFDNSQSLLVTGILEKLPINSHIVFDMLISFETFKVPPGYLADLNSWGWAGFHTYALLTPEADHEFINEQILKMYNENMNRANITTITELQPLLSIYLDSGKYSNIGPFIRSGSRSTIYGLTVVAILILFMAGFNFMNLSTALSLGRGKEIGIRKTMGAAKGRIVSQFLVESELVSFISLIAAIALILFSQSYFYKFLGISLPEPSEYLNFLPLILGGTVVIGILAGLYPSLVLSSFSPISALTGNLKTGKGGSIFRSSLMIFQFAISLMLIAGSMIIISQIEYISNKHLGFDKENILKIKVPADIMDKSYASLKNSFEQHADVMEVATTSHSFNGGTASGPAVLKGAPEDQAFQLAYYQTDEDFLNLTNIELIEGRFFLKDFQSDSTAMVMNESAVALMELEDPIGTQMTFAGTERKVIGVVKDFHFNSLHLDIGPMAILLPFTFNEVMLVKVAPGNVSNTLFELESDWKSITDAAPFDATFLDDSIQKMYEKEEKLSALINLFTGLAIILACLGLYGLVAFSVQSRLKEVGIRKVLGANLSELLIILSKQFFLMILLANLIAWPLIYFFSNQWLDNFAYRIDLQWWTYLLSGIMLLVIALVTISYQTFKAANTNPVNVLRSE